MDRQIHRVLVVEDEVLVAMNLSMELQAEGFEVVETAASGMSAVRIARDEQIDAILMDIGLPGEIDGIEAARQIREFSSVPIIFMTGYVDREHDPAVQAVTPLAFLIKPVSFHRLLALLTESVG